MAAPLEQHPKPDFLRAWCAVAYTFPGLYLDGYEEAESGWRRSIPLFGKPDFVFRRVRVVVFVDGCFWHGCPRRATKPANNRVFWEAKLARNAERDREVTRTLRKEGWRVLRVWECALTRARSQKTAARIARAVCC